MRPAQSLVPLAACLSSLVVPAAAGSWPGVRWPLGIRDLVGRADEPASSSSASSASEQSPTAAPGSAANADGTAPRTGAGQNTAEPTGTGAPSGSGTEDSGSQASQTEIPPDAPPGGVNMLIPATTADPSPLFKIRDTVTLSWNYTSVIRTPKAVDVIASCSAASDMWTLTQNMTFATAAKYVWDSKKQANRVEKPLPEELYTLIIKDSEAAITAPPEPGYLGSYKALTFGLYSGKPYTPFADWKCTGCSGATSLVDGQAVSLAITMSVITLLSFTWFVADLGLC